MVRFVLRIFTEEIQRSLDQNRKPLIRCVVAFCNSLIIYPDIFQQYL
jgi:hypothetical protein